MFLAARGQCKTLVSTMHLSGSQRVGAFVGLSALIRQLGADSVVVLSDAGLSPDALDNPQSRVPYAAVARVFHYGAHATNCPHFGLLAGRMWHFVDLGIVGELVRNSPTVGEALRKLTLYQHLNSECAVPFLREVAGVVDLGCAIYGSELRGLDHLYDAYMAAGVNFMRELCGPGWNPTEVFIPHVKPADITHYRHLFKVQPHFDAELCALRFPARWMQRAVPGADAQRLLIAEQRARTAGRPEIVQQVSRALRILLLNGNNSGDDVARMLSMHRRTLNRRLKDEGTTFQIVLDQIRFDVARQLLSFSDISLDDVAGTLGYAGVSPFMRSFHRWAGTTPGHWRRDFGFHNPNAPASSFRARLEAVSGVSPTRSQFIHAARSPFPMA
jgi:AraC-like DNA-binding protein